MKFLNTLLVVGIAGFTGSAWALTVSESDIANKTDAVTIGEASVNGQTKEVLTDSQGRSLYTFSLDSAGKSNCKGGCLNEWPPLNVAPNAVVLAPFAVITGNNGKPQLTLQGMPLYYYDDDKKPGDAFGNYPKWASILVTKSVASALTSMGLAFDADDDGYNSRQSLAGHTFTAVKNHPELGDASLDENLVIWGDIVVKSHLTDMQVATYCQNNNYSTTLSDICQMDEAHAAAYCASIGAQLPTHDQFVTLDKLVGDSNTTMDINGNFLKGQEQTEVIPHLAMFESKLDKNGLVSYWSSTPHNQLGYVFQYGADAALQIQENDVLNEYLTSTTAVRCVEQGGK